MKPDFFDRFHIGRLACFLLLTASVSLAAEGIRTERVHFKKGAKSAVVEASIKGYETVDYVLGARAGQYMNVSLATKHGATYFNILAPGQNEVAMFNGSVSQNQYEGTLPASGDYKIRVYMMRSAARRNEVAHYRLEMIIDGDGQLSGTAFAQDPVPSLQDLVGARGGDAEMALRNRGYTWVRTRKSGDDIYSYWRENENGQCVAIRTIDGRYASIVFSPPSDCEKVAERAPLGQAGRGFETVCGVIVGGKQYRYKCKIEDYYEGERRAHSVLYFHDQTLKMVWKSGKVVELHFEGMVPKQTKYATSEGETNFVFEDKTYFYISNKDMARKEVERFRN